MLKSGVIRALGAMSGTSLDGVDAAVLVTDGVTITEFGPSDFRPYSKEESSVLRAALGKWGGAEVEAAAEVIETAHAQILSGFEDVDLIGFHGQTVAHDPANRGTLQIGDGALLAEVLERPVVWDFRSNDVKLGGQGAPLAPFYHFALAKFIGATAPVAFLNLGGVGNITWVDPTKAKPEDAGALIAFDTGPANAPINDLMVKRLRVDRDENGDLAAEGNVDEDILNRFLDHRYFYKIPPKSLDRDDFAALATEVEALSDADAAATLTACAAMAVVKGMEHCPSVPAKLLVTGGGRHNATLMAMLSAGLDCEVAPVEDAGLDGDMLEAQAFAFLAVRLARGLPTSCPSTTGVGAAVGGGTVSHPLR
ncbi:anhydro-N-acetylmuramic acid kinase [Marivivens donghaensis]|uniref:anhydro-N-acetylmuramic acid kinase n=1 Tax=Marivivens donghaensis TaxID=1699413 RepID=UPI00201E755F|nr:anhydro-N-acetylmuramic acid kinase [Marivivens donghaensis]MCL7409986.1 anhydro-N-acetylmuramic acid kinase [Marivivens donghaensis]MDN3705413.1 anhydro-N-acetylmuramic acid kinase [Marivivens donghaensis]